MSWYGIFLTVPSAHVALLEYSHRWPRGASWWRCRTSVRFPRSRSWTAHGTRTPLAANKWTHKLKSLCNLSYWAITLIGTHLHWINFASYLDHDNQKNESALYILVYKKTFQIDYGCLKCIPLRRPRTQRDRWAGWSVVPAFGLRNHQGLSG